MNNFSSRTVTGIAIIGVVIGAVSLNAYTFLFLCLVTSLLGLTEFYHLFQVDKHTVRKISGLTLSGCLLISSALFVSGHFHWRILLVNLPLISWIFISELYLRSASPFLNLAYIFLGIVYITLPFTLLFSLAFIHEDVTYHPKILLGYFFLLWANDTGAFVTGTQLGKHALAHRISPHKTWEGSMGGAWAVMVLVFMNTVFFTELSFLNWFIIGLIVIVMGTLGDLVKSVMKRSLNVKDSGTILPGHGGILDRFDSLIGSVPFVYTYLAFL